MVRITQLDLIIVRWLKRYGLQILRFSLGIVFIWFGLLKIFSQSPANQLITKTIYWFDPNWFIPLLGGWEILIGLCFLHRKLLRLGIFLMMLQMLGTFLPLLILPGIVYTKNIFYLTLEGQYIIKNLVLIAAALVIGSHVREKR